VGNKYEQQCVEAAERFKEMRKDKAPTEMHKPRRKYLSMYRERERCPLCLMVGCVCYFPDDLPKSMRGKAV